MEKHYTAITTEEMRALIDYYAEAMFATTEQWNRVDGEHANSPNKLKEMAERYVAIMEALEAAEEKETE